MVHTITKMAIITKDNGKMTNVMVLEKKSILMVLGFKVFG
jgi:hypothetical protein